LIDKLRYVLNTHEQVCHPHQLSVLISRCTSGSEEKSVSQLLSCLTGEIGINRRACEFLIDLALKMELVERDLHWSGRGWVINAFTSHKTDLTEPEKVAYLKYYLDTDGALIINFLKELNELGDEGLLMSRFLNEGGVERVFVKTAEDYLQEVFDISPRYELSKLLVLRDKNYSSKVRTDKFFTHIQPLVDLGFVRRSYENNAVKYGPVVRNEKGKMANLTAILSREFSSVLDLGHILSKNGDFFRRASISFGLTTEKIDQMRDYSNIKQEIVRAYDETKDEYFRLARLNSIYDMVCIRLLHAPPRRLCEQSDVIRTIERMHEESEKDIRFHVSDSGAREFVTISKDYVNAEFQK